MAHAGLERRLVGRDAECEEIGQLLRLARQGHGGGLLLCGDAGVGKSALLDHAVALADGMTVLAARGIEAESEIPYSGLSELLGPVMDGLSGLPDRQAQALAGALAVGPPTGADPFAVGAATLSLLAAAASVRPTLVVVDDLQWFDSASADAIRFATRRLSFEPIAVVCAMRTTDDVLDPIPGLPTRRLIGLDRAAARELLSGELDGPIPEDAAERLFVETAGNPLALIEIPRLLPRGLVTTLEASGDEPLPVSARIQEAFRRRVEGLSARSTLALLVAAANDAADVDPVLRAIAQLGLAAADLEATETTSILAIRDDRLVFCHPLARSSIYRAAQPARRREVHRALARALEGGDEISEARRAWHLAAASIGCDETIAEALERAATSARRRSGFVAAARTWERAGRLSPAPLKRARRLHAAAEMWQLANHHDHAIELLDEVAPLAIDRTLAADIEHLRARIDTWRGPALQACVRLRTVADGLRDVDPGRSARMLTDAVLAGITGGDLHQALAAAEEAQGVARAVGGTVELEAELQLGKARVLTGDVAGGFAPLMHAVGLLLGAPLGHHTVLVEAVPALMTVEEYALAERVLDVVIAAQRADNAFGLLAYGLAARAELQMRIGRWSEAAANGAEAVQLASESRQLGQLSYNLARLARLEAALGQEAECRADVARSLGLASRREFGSSLPFATSALGLLELGLGRITHAVDNLQETAALWRDMGFHEPGRLEFQADLVEALTRDGRRDDAAAVLADLEQQAMGCRRVVADGRPDTACTLARAAAARCRGILADPEEAEPFFRDALGWHAWSVTPFEQARTELCMGEQLRRAGRRQDAREHLARSLAAFERLGARPWVGRASVELAATGEHLMRRHHRATEDLTPQEYQVALLVASGATNREAGAALFVTPKTVEFHLAKIYRKLELRSRTELAAWAGRQDTGWAGSVRLQGSGAA